MFNNNTSDNIIEEFSINTLGTIIEEFNNNTLETIIQGNVETCCSFKKNMWNIDHYLYKGAQYYDFVVRWPLRGATILTLN